jgi:hypothetical protein
VLATVNNIGDRQAVRVSARYASNGMLSGTQRKLIGLGANSRNNFDELSPKLKKKMVSPGLAKH